MNFKILVFPVLIISTLCFGALFKESLSNTQHKLIAEKIDTYLKIYAGFSGAVLLAQNDTVIFNKAYGCANYEFNIANDHTTKFCIASNTKSFTAVAIMQLQEKGLLHVHDKLSKYIADFPNGNNISIHHLLTHTSGIPNYYKYWDTISHCVDTNQMINAIKTWPQEFEPGVKYCYTNTGYLLLAYIIEKASGLSFEQYLVENIFKPLGMSNSGSIINGRMIKNKASGYIIKDSVIYNVPSIVSSETLVGSGDLYASIDDVHRFNQALHTGKILSKNGLDTLLAAHIAMENSECRAHGYGWFIDKKQGKHMVEYSGAIIGYLSKVMRFIDDNITIIILTNVEDQDSFLKVCDDIPKLLFDE